MIFSYKAANSAGAMVAGELEAAEKKAALRELQDKGLTVTEISGVDANGKKSTGSATTQDLLLSLHEMATLLESGVSIAETIGAQSKANYPADLREQYQIMANEIRKGVAFADALRVAEFKLPDYFSPLVEAGELTGNMAGALRQGVNQFEYDLKMNEEFRSALIYPSVLVASGIGAVLLIFVFVVPKFAPLVSRSDDLPLLSKVVLSGGMFFNDHFWWVVAGLVLVIFLLSYAASNSKFRSGMLQLGFRLPVIGTWLNEADTASWTSLMSTLLSSSVDLLRSMELARQGMRSARRRIELDHVLNEVKAGQGLADSLEKANALTPTGYNLIRSGERTGRLPAMMKSVADLYSEAARKRMTRMLALIEPLSILIIGGVIGVIILGVILAITSINGLVT
ncbi:type II secretion system F family protein [Gammaproteobacteria bacterium]|nr:type II secretion system F family protein [Gammaproteobacteria bacterium]